MKKLYRLTCLLMALALLATCAMGEGLDIEYEYEDVPVSELNESPVEELEFNLGDDASEAAEYAPELNGEGAWVGDFRINGTVLTEVRDSAAEGVVKVPNGITEIGPAVFAYKDKITSVVLPNSVTTIRNYAFQSCGKSTGFTVNLPSTITSIGTGAFYTSHLTSVTIPSSVTTIEYETFFGCDKLTSVSIPNTVTRITFCAFKKCTALSNITVPGSVAEIEHDTFQNCTNLSSVTLGEGVTKIGEFAFSHCEKLTSVSLPSTLTTIERYAFSHCYALPSITIPNGVTVIPDYAFVSCGALRNVNLPSGLTGIRESAFQSCTSLVGFNGNSYIAFPDSFASVGRTSFTGCSSISSVRFSGDYVGIGLRAFLDCTSLSDIQFLCSRSNVESNSSFYNISPNAVFKVRCCNNDTISRFNAWGYTVSQTHGNIQTQPAVEATCTEQGHTSYQKCTDCDTNITEPQVIPAKGHTPVVDPAVPATCTAHGLTEGSHCSVCNAVLVAQEETPFADHTPVVDPAVEPTFTKPGKTEGSHCSVCGAVIVAQEEIPKLTGTVKLNKTGTQKLVVGKKLQLKATVDPASVSKYLTWKSNKPKVASVDKNGKVKALKKGTAVISAKLPNGKGATVKIKVVAPNPTKIKITNKGPLKLKVGKKVQLKTKLTPKNAETKLKWKSANPKIATVSAKGLVTAKKAGKTKITVTTSNNKKTTIVVNVVKK